MKGLDDILLARKPEWSGRRLAAKLGVLPEHVTRWRQCRVDPKLGTAIRIADALEVTLDELAGRVSPAVAAAGKLDLAAQAQATRLQPDHTSSTRPASRGRGARPKPT